MKNLQKEKAKAIPQATIVAGVFSQFEKRNRMIRFSSTFFFSSASTHTHTYNMKKFFFAQQNEIKHFDLVKQHIYQKNVSYLLVKCDMHRSYLIYAFSYFILSYTSFSIIKKKKKN